VEPHEVQALYGGAYAASYNDIWQNSDAWRAEAGHHVRHIGEHIGPDTKWLDAGCGTGFNLSHFAGTERAGLDLSPDMLAEARKANPDATFRQGDLRVDIPEWHEKWDLVTCTGQPWSYVDSMGEIETILTNLAGWTAPTGTCFLPMADLSDVTGFMLPLVHPDDPDPYDAPIIDGVIWSLWENNRYHRSQVWPSVSWCVGVMARHFARIDIVKWPHDAPLLPIARRVLVATDKRAPGDQRRLVLIDHPVPSGGVDPNDVHDEQDPARVAIVIDDDEIVDPSESRPAVAVAAVPATGEPETEPEPEPETETEIETETETEPVASEPDTADEPKPVPAPSATPTIESPLRKVRRRLARLLRG
jgi:SAM-dependent methyltransferase